MADGLHISFDFRHCSHIDPLLSGDARFVTDDRTNRDIGVDGLRIVETQPSYNLVENALTVPATDPQPITTACKTLATLFLANFADDWRMLAVDREWWLYVSEIGEAELRLSVVLETDPIGANGYRLNEPGRPVRFLHIVGQIAVPPNCTCVFCEKPIKFVTPVSNHVRIPVLAATSNGKATTDNVAVLACSHNCAVKVRRGNKKYKEEICQRRHQNNKLNCAIRQLNQTLSARDTCESPREVSRQAATRSSSSPLSAKP